MQSFLQYVANDLLRRFPDDLSRCTIVFPNKRAGLFLNDCLLQAAAEQRGTQAQALWSPRYSTISDLFRSLSPLSVADPIELVCRLYPIYRQHTGDTVSLDYFYGWGERLLADFDDVDKNLAPVERLFRNLRDIKQLETTDYIDEKQEQALQAFFHDFSLQQNSRLRQKFLQLWDQLFPIYRDLNASLAATGQAYEGALYRSVAEGLQSGRTSLPEDVDTYAFVGFNVLDKAEETLFAHLRDAGKALFYWDYDKAYTAADTQFEAGVFLRRNIGQFPCALPEDIYDNLLQEKTIEFVAASSESIAAQSVTPWLQTYLTNNNRHTAIVICNENLLQPVLHAIPPEIKDLNVTKGFPLGHTEAYSMVVKLLDTAQETTATDLLRHIAAEIRRTVLEIPPATPPGTAGGSDTHDHLRPFTDIFRREAFFQAHLIVNRLLSLAEKGLLDVRRLTLRRLLLQVLRQKTIPFHGEPAIGLQIMGVLETRNLDFEHLLVLSCGEGLLPKHTSDNSFIPYALRAEFGLTTSRHKVAVFAYYFYRLIQRARHVTFVYNNSTDGLRKGEMSRFMTQLLVETRLPVRHWTLTAGLTLHSRRPEPIGKPEGMERRLARISPSAVNTYLRCPLSFYFQEIRKLGRQPDPSEGIDYRLFGTLFHAVAERIYADANGQAYLDVTPAMLDTLLSKEGELTLLQYIREAFAAAQCEQNELIEQVLLRYIRQLLRADRRTAPFRIVKPELKVELPLQVDVHGRKTEILLHGIVDRLDIVGRADGQTALRVLDYKTGGRPEKADSLEALFTPGDRHPHYILQACLYGLIIERATPQQLEAWQVPQEIQQLPLSPALFFVHKAAAEDYSPEVRIGGAEEYDFRDDAAEFREHLCRLLAEILDPTRPFLPTETPKNCLTCEFQHLCYH